MLYNTAKKLMTLPPELKFIAGGDKGYMISFEIKEEGLLRSQYFPDKHEKEPLILNVDLAWQYAEYFANNVDKTKIVNIYVIDCEFNPVNKKGVRMIEIPAHKQERISFNKY